MKGGFGKADGHAAWNSKIITKYRGCREIMQYAQYIALIIYISNNILWVNCIIRQPQYGDVSEEERMKR